MGDRTPDEIGALDVRTRGANSGVCPLDGSSLVPLANIPAELTGKNAGTATMASDSDKVDGKHASAEPTADTVPVADVNGKLDGWVTPVTVALTKYFESSEQTITSAGGLTLAHGFGVEPKLVQCILVCKTAEAGYSINDKVCNVTTGQGTITTDNLGVSIVPDSTNLNIRYGSNNPTFTILNRVDGSVALITNSRWKAIFRAWA